MTKILLSFFNALMWMGYYPKSWTKVLDVIVDKGKECVAGKLRTIQLIEADSQLIMRMCMSQHYRKCWSG